MKKILFVSSYPNYKCGVSDYSKDLLQNIHNSKLEVSYFTIKFIDNPIKYVIDSIRLLSILLIKKYDKVNFQYTPTILGQFAPLFLIIIKLKNERIIVTIHESYISYLEHLPSLFHPLLRLYELSLVTMCDFIIVLSNYQKQNILNNFDIDQ